MQQFKMRGLRGKARNKTARQKTHEADPHIWSLPFCGRGFLVSCLPHTSLQANYILPFSATRETGSNSFAIFFHIFEKFIYASVLICKCWKTENFVLFVNAALWTQTKISFKIAVTTEVRESTASALNVTETHKEKKKTGETNFLKLEHLFLWVQV